MQKSPYLSDGAEGFGLATIDDNGTVLDTWFPVAHLHQGAPATATMALAGSPALERLGHWARLDGTHDPRRGISVVAMRTTIDSLANAPVDIHDIYLRMHLLSMRVIRPREANIDGFLDLLSDVAWTTLGPCLPEKASAMQWTCRAAGVPVEIQGIFKVPRMLDYVVPSDVWIASADRVLMGAYLAPGTSVMPEGFCGINAGTLGPCMVEGRISLGAVVGEESDVGGGASIMGTTSGGGHHRVTIGKRCLLGANSGVGVSLGDDCVVEAGLYLTAGTRVRMPSGEVVKALTLSSRSGLIFRRHSETGQVEAIERDKAWGGLNWSIHQPSAQPYKARPAA